MVKSFVIDRNTWSRAIPTGGTNSLLRDDGKRCCLGFYAAACGVSDVDAYEESYPSGLGGVMPEEMEWTQEDNDNGTVQTSIATDNDTTEITEEERESRVVAHFAAQGIEVIFIN